MQTMRADRRTERQLTAVPIGTATTVDQVLDRGSAYTAQRRAVLNALAAFPDGRIEDGSGKATRILMRKMNRTGSLTSLSTLLRSMESEKQIGRQILGKRCSAIFLLDPVKPTKYRQGGNRPCPDCDKVFQTASGLRKHHNKEHSYRLPEDWLIPSPEETVATVANHNGHRSTVAAEYPPLGSSVTVFAIHLNDDDSVTIGLRGVDGSWMTKVEGYVADQGV